MPPTISKRLALAAAALLAVWPTSAQTPADRLNGRSVFARDSSGAAVPAPASKERGYVPPASGGVLDRYRAVHEQRVLARVFGATGGAIRVADAPLLPISNAETEAWMRFIGFRDLPITVEPLPPVFAVETVDYVPPSGRLAFRNRFRHTRWAYAGTTYRTALDTARTWRLRAALEGRYGPPTQTLSDLGADVRLGPGTAFMFEYWFVVNDSIPLLVTDAGSPTDRGLVIGTDGERRIAGSLLRDLIFAALASDPLRPYADYRFEPEARTWEVVGYDGVRLVRRTIPRPDFRLEGRPRLEQLAAPPRSPRPR